MSSFHFETTRRIVCRVGAARDLAAILRPSGVRHVLVVTDKGLMQSGVLSASLKALAEAGLAVTVFSDVQADPPESSVLQAIAVARAHECDGVIGMGGGSSMDTAKLVAALAPSSSTLTQVYGVGLIQGQRLPLLQVPTTAGTGSEATPVAVVTTPDGEKKGVVSAQMYPDAAVLDAELTLGLPAAVTAMTGVDAMVHAIESYTNRVQKNPLSDALASQALHLLYHHIERAVQHGDDLQARESMLVGSLFAGMAFANASVGAVHVLAAPLGGKFHVPHGLSVALMLQPVLQFNMSAAAPLYAQLGRSLDPNLHRVPDAAAAETLVQRLDAMVASMPFAHRLGEVGVHASDVPGLIDDALRATRLLANNPREVSASDALAMYQSVL